MVAVYPQGPDHDHPATRMVEYSPELSPLQSREAPQFLVFGGRESLRGVAALYRSRRRYGRHRRPEATAGLVGRYGGNALLQTGRLGGGSLQRQVRRNN